MGILKRFNIGVLLIILVIMLFVKPVSIFRAIQGTDHADAIINGETPSSSIDLQIAHINTSLPHYQYEEIKNKLLNEKGIAEAGDRNLASTIFGTVGISKKVRFPRINEKNSAPEDNGYYLSLTKYTIDPDCTVYRDSGKTYLAYQVWDDTIYNAKGKFNYRNGHWATRQLKVEINPPNKSNMESGNEEKTILIPLSVSTFRILDPVFKVITMLAVIFLLYVYIALPISTIQNIAFGKVFIQNNIRNLRMIAFTTIITTIVYMITPFIFYILYNKIIPKEFHLSFENIFTSGLQWLIAGLVVLVIARAFNQGRKLQEDQSLTI